MDNPIFMHERLTVYKRARDFARDADSISADWRTGMSRCVVDHFQRASESIVINIAGGVSAFTSESKAQKAGYALGSTAECSACLDIAAASRLSTIEARDAEKARLSRIYSMLWKLRESWLSLQLKDEPNDTEPRETVPIGHEKLDVYKVSIEYISCLEELFHRGPISSRFVRSLDASATSIVLNIAEGNSRVAVADRAKFFRDSDAATTRSAALLDLCHRPGERDDADETIAAGKRILSRVGAMIGGLLR